MEETVLQRIRKIINLYSVSDRRFAEAIGLAQTTMSSLFSRGSEPNVSIVKSILNVYTDISPIWLLTGEGEMLKSEPTIIKPQPKQQNVIKYFPTVSGSMGGVEFLDDPNESYDDIILPGFSECKYAINAYGDSMHPVIKSGQVVILMEWTESFIDWGRIYLVVTKSGYRIIKYLKPSDNADAIRCESENKELNPAFDINREDIHKLFLVKGWVCRDTI
jgi:transcriptional regulator with XRE-family HTH domain|nr:S24 family peptidase [uncultured Bacteroides sp.]DAK77794.1 MAG TPA: Repressor protein CI [Caudoviricetes sp.]